MEQERVLERNEERRNAELMVVFFLFLLQFSQLEEVHASIVLVLENFTFSLLSGFGILM